MKLRISKRNKFILIFVILLLAIGVVYIQFFYLSPLRSDLSLKKKTLETEQALLNARGQKKQGNTDDHLANTRELQKELPVKAQQDQFILDLEQAETISNSQIKSMSFTNDGQSETQSGQNNGIDVQQNASSSTNGNTGQSNSPSSNGTTNQTTEKTLPTGIKKLTVQLSVESPGYEEFEKFIDALEGLKRILVVEAIDYSVGTEQTALDQGDKPFAYTLTVSSFYMPGLIDLQGQLPEMETPNPAGKQNPLSQFPDVPTH